jgi:hypothetical protein
VFDLAKKYSLEDDLVDQLFCSSNVWKCLEYAVEHSETETHLLEKCEKMLKMNHTCYTDATMLRSIKGSTIAHALSMEALPLKKVELNKFMKLWKEANEGQANLMQARP